MIYEPQGGELTVVSVCVVFQDGSSLSTSLNSVRPEEITVELRKIAGSLGISISVSS